jgi:transposase
VPEDFCQIATTPSEDVEIAGMGIAPQTFLNQQRQTLHATPHVRVPRRDPDLDAARYRDHRRDSAFKTRDSAAVSTSAQTMIRSTLRKNDFHLADRMRAIRFRGRVRRNRYRKDRYGVLLLDRIDAHLATPSENEVGVDVVSSRNIGDRRTFFLAFFDNPTLLLKRPVSTSPIAAAARNHRWCPLSDSGHDHRATLARSISASGAQRQAAAAGGLRFEVIPHRWVVERTFAWMTRWRRLVRDYEERIDCSEAMIHVALGSVLLRRIAHQ